MSNLSKELRNRLEEEHGSVLSSRISGEQSDEDGTVKLGITLADGAVIETVLLRDEKERRTACLSSQVGCAMGCSFCRTATMGLVRNLSGGEIVEQLLHLRSRFGELDNIVFMGMGEPLANLPAVRSAVAIFTHPKGLGMSPRRITISTCGLVAGIRSLAAEGPAVRLALSLVSARGELREKLMPITRSNPLNQLKQALAEWYEQHGKRITLEYVAIGGENTGAEDARRLARFARGLAVMVNVIPWNPAAELPFREPTQRELDDFMLEVEQQGLSLTRRFRRGRGVNGACGQLAVLERDGEESAD
jgi:23S rRNA (adenine2503-C2)-methyltransferase